MKTISRPTLRIIVFYFGLAAAWILFTQQGLPGLAPITSWGLVFATGIWLYVLLAKASHPSKPSEARSAIEKPLAAPELAAKDPGLYRQLVDLADEGIWSLDENFRTVFVNPATTQMLGYAPEEMLGVPVNEFIIPEDQEDHQTKTQARRKGLTQQYERRFRRKDGGIIWAFVSASPCFSETGAFTGAFAMLTDITAHKQAEQNLHQRNEELTIIAEILRSVTTRLNLQELLNEALRGALKLTGADGGTFCLVNNERQSLRLMASQNASQELVDELSKEDVLIGKCLCGEAAQTGQPLILPDSASESQYATHTAIRQEKIRFHGAFPLVAKSGSTCGILCIFCRSAHQPSPHQLQILQDLCGPIALAVENALFVEENSRQIERLQALYQGAQTLSESLDFRALAVNAVRVCVETFGARLAWLGRAEPDGSIALLSFYPSEITYPTFIRARWDDAPEGQGPTGRAIRIGLPQVMTSFEIPVYLPWREAATSAGFCSSAAFPLIGRDQALGALNLYSDQNNYFTPQRIEFFQAYACQVAAALENARLFEAVQQYANELEQRVAERTTRLQSLNQELRNEISERQRTSEKIQALNADLEHRAVEMEAFSYSVSHDLRAPLRAITGFSEILARRHQQTLDEEGRHYLDNIIQAGQRMGRLIDDLLQYARLGRKGITLQSINLTHAIQRIATDLAERLNQADGTLTIASNLPVVRGDITLVNETFTNLLDNAITYRRKDVPLQISVTSQERKSDVVIAVRDNGIGIPLEYCEKIFQVFQRLHNDEDYPGTGIGLAIVKKSVELMGGMVWVESVLGVGSTFFIRLQKEKR